MSVSEKMASYELSQAAERDFESIFEYGIETFGLEQGLRYQNGMVQRFDKLAEAQASPGRRSYPHRLQAHCVWLPFDLLSP